MENSTENWTPPSLIISETSKLKIVPFEERHLTERYISWLNNKEVVRYSELRHRTHTYDTCYKYWKSYEGTDNFLWAIELYGEKWEHIGNVSALVEKENEVADIGILIGEQKTWGCGYGFLAWKAVCNYLLQELKFRKITGGTLAVNKSMLRIMQRAGMVEDGKRERHYICEGKEVDIFHYALFGN